MNARDLLRFFWLVSRPPAYLLVVLVVLVLTGITLEVINESSSDFALGSILLIQLFAVSTGFRRYSSRGYFDPALVSGASRLSIGWAHFLASALPGICAWVVVGLAEVVRAGSVHVMAFRAGGASSLLLI